MRQNDAQIGIRRQKAQESIRRGRAFARIVMSDRLRRMEKERPIGGDQHGGHIRQEPRLRDIDALRVGIDLADPSAPSARQRSVSAAASGEAGATIPSQTSRPLLAFEAAAR